MKQDLQLILGNSIMKVYKSKRTIGQEDVIARVVGYFCKCHKRPYDKITKNNKT